DWILFGKMMWSLTAMMPKPSASPCCASVAMFSGVAMGPRGGRAKPKSMCVPFSADEDTHRCCYRCIDAERCASPAAGSWSDAGADAGGSQVQPHVSLGNGARSPSPHVQAYCPRHGSLDLHV